MLFFEELKKYDIILASKSPRRQQLLKESLIPFRVLSFDFDEEIEYISTPGEVVVNICKLKAESIIKQISNNNTILITADTIVWFENQILNKPNNKEEAVNMLAALSGQKHYVFTGVCLKSIKKEKTFYEKTAVLFEKLTRDEIEYYCNNFEPYDKAGSYGIQEWLGLAGVKKIEGSYHNVVGLPVARLFKELKTFIKD